MPSQLHDVLVQLFRNRPLLAPELLRDALNVGLPQFTEARIDSRCECPVCVLVVTVDEAVARWAGKPVEMGNGSEFARRHVAEGALGHCKAP